MPPKSYDYTEASAEYERTRISPKSVWLADGTILPKSVRPADQRGDWAVYAFNTRKGDWEIQPEFIGVSLEIALTAILRWKDQGQDVRIETIPA